MALTGTYPRSLDDKLRLAIPKRLREEFGEGELKSLYIAPGTDKSLELHSEEGFERLATKLAAQPSTRVDVRHFIRLFYARADKVELDGQGRIRIPERLATLAGLSREVVLLGVHDHAEIWDAAGWEEFLGRVGPDFDSLASQAFT